MSQCRASGLGEQEPQVQRIKHREKCNVCGKIRSTGNTAEYRNSVDLPWKKNSETENELRIGG